jgi:hypothetical protein
MGTTVTSPPPIGSTADMLNRLKAVLPSRWFPDSTPILDGVLTGLATTTSTLYAMLGYVRLQTRIATATDSFLDLAATDYCGGRISRAAAEPDPIFRARLQRELLRTRATRLAVSSALSDVTGRIPAIFEPQQPSDTGVYGAMIGYGVAGAWGSLSMPFQSLVVAYRPFPSGSPAWTGGPGPGAPAPGTALVTLPLADAAIYAAVARVMPIAATCWTAISN